MKKRIKKIVEEIGDDWEETFWLVYHFHDEDYDQTILWFDTPNPRLAGETPFEMLKSEVGRYLLRQHLDTIRCLTLH